jgi:hypothetical protein
LGPIAWFVVFNSHVQHDLPCKKCAKNTFYKRCSNKIFDSQTKVFSKVQNRHNMDPIVKLGSLGHNLLKYCTYLSLPWPYAIISVRVRGNCRSL